ncbi:hypothetical protein VU00_10123 [Candidatus Electrothrix marina]|uniref:Uncharacterized protein n=1 Tax=Candidatus Electrothrix marina TaxID=1859130 RepID=A0A3S3SUP2_9BACT|nr:hypothetical protein VU00_10123 [Candidatus Electrothrix marina]
MMDLVGGEGIKETDPVVPPLGSEPDEISEKCFARLSTGT